MVTHGFWITAHLFANRHTKLREAVRLTQGHPAKECELPSVGFFLGTRKVNAKPGMRM